MGTRPTFYLVPVSQVLSDAVTAGPTKVRRCVTVAGYLLDITVVQRRRGWFSDVSLH